MMGMARQVVVAGIALAGLTTPAFADHDHAGMAMSSSGTDVGSTSAVAVGMSFVAAQFDTMYYAGSYQGVVPSVSWSRGAWSASASLSMYHLDENGLGVYGLGDSMVHGHVDVLGVPWGRVGVAAMIMVPSANGQNGLGMGHLMVMPSAWTVATLHAVTLSASAGFSRALVDLADHVHGIWPLVDPMNMSEITWSGGADVGVGRGVHAGGRLFGGYPIGAPGIDRVIAAARVSWGGSRVLTGGELQAGLAGDPFTIRGVVDTALRF